MLCRIFTELVNKTEVARLAAQYFPGFSMIEGLGYYDGSPEPMLLIEINTQDFQGVKRLAEAILTLNDQDAILIQRVPIRSWVVTQKQPALGTGLHP